MSRGGFRPGAGRPARRYGDIVPAELLAEVERVTPPTTLAALFADARGGDIRALRMLTEIYDKAEQRALRDVDGVDDNPSSRSLTPGARAAAPPLAAPAPDLFSSGGSSARSVIGGEAQ